jgi:protein-S-isoprenylcysteine O-methyltransferase Ste14
MSADRGENARDGAAVWIQPPLLFAGGVLLGAALQQWAWALEFAPESGLRRALGVAVICGGVAILLSTFAVFRRMGQHPDPRKPTPAVSRDGPYRFTRNPMYVGGSLVQLGIGIAFGNAWIVALLIPVVLLIHYGAIVPEERYLERKFGDEYTRFKESVRRWL